MKRILALVLVLFLFAPAQAVFAENAPSTLPADGIQTAVETFLKAEMTRQEGLAEDEWQRYIYRQGIGPVTLSLEGFDLAAKKPLSVSFLVASAAPDYDSQESYEGDPLPYLEALVQSMSVPKAPVKLNLDVAVQGEQVSATFAKGGEAALQKAVKALASKAPKAVADNRMLSALTDYLMPTPIVLPKKEPADIAAEKPNPAYAAYMDRNHLNPSTIGAFAPAFLYAPKPQKLNAARGPEAVALSYTVPYMADYLGKAFEAMITDSLPNDTKAKEYTNQELLMQFSAQLEKEMLAYRYTKDTTRTDVYLVNLLQIPKTISPDALFEREGGSVSEAAMAYVDAMEELVKELPDKPPLPLPANGVVLGENTGTKVIFTFYKTSFSNHAVSAYDHWTNQLVCISFSADRKAVEMRLPKGDYDFKIDAGTVWYGQEDMFGPFSATSFLSGDYLQLRSTPYKVTVNMSE